MTKKVMDVFNGLSAMEKDEIYRMVWAGHVTEDILSYAKDVKIKISKEDAEVLAQRYVKGDYDCNLSYWDNIERLIVG